MSKGVIPLNFVEIMALQRAFSIGHFKCSGISPKICVADYLGDGYVLRIKKGPVNKFCFNCIEDFCTEKGLHICMYGDYLTIYSL
jgi:hypothetical protein